MPITRLLADITIPPEQQNALELAFRAALRKLELVDRDDSFCALVARKMLELHQRGVTDAVALSELTIREIGMQRFNSASARYANARLERR
ncbi:hypothetical protein JQ604_39405 [Bradyrhizobium jicamae]|uniref:hypothetical protein n=1 Tax=Bradyrhizobium jicamae TaxID=280332 RepID=UPI001BABC3EC|nr:hypothetical protein [Bradyrhizobium jicamae]MBR0758284.1 hypothetical protein [Bradyrhizobium jicamae]